MSIYDEPWQVLKRTGHVTLKLVGSDDPKIIKKQAATYRKAITKRKYEDEEFRVQYPKAQLSSRLDVSSACVRFTLDKNDLSGLEY